MSENERERDIRDEDLPEDLRPTEDNPLAQGLTDDDEAKSAEELDMEGGKAPEQRDEDDSEE